MSPNFIQEQLSLSYVRSVAFRSGCNLSAWSVDDHGIDGTIKGYARGINRFDFQLKATTRYQVRDENIIYDLRVEDYNRLTRDDDLPRILVVYIMPQDDGQWLSQSSDELCLRNCAYWESLMGRASSSNANTVRVSIPMANVFDQNGLGEIFRTLVV